MAKGYLKVNIYNDTIANPIENATVIILKNEKEILTTTTNENGQTETIPLDTIEKRYSQTEQYSIRPYETYDIMITALGFTPTKIEGVQIFDTITSIQNIYITSIDDNQTEITSEITPNTLWGNYAPNLINNQPKENTPSPILLNQVIIPQTIIVHDGIPSNSTAPNYTVPFIDYIKNVASSEIYSTWPKETIKANIIAIISFTLNRIFTEWYPSQGYNFTITSTTTYDQKYTKNGTIFEPISNIVEEIFTEYIKKGIRIEPLLAHYKNNTSEPGYLSQWGSKELGDQGYNALQILRYYYGNDINLYQAKTTNTYPYSFQSTLKEGDCNKDVYRLQNSLNYIRSSYPGIPVIPNPNGYFDTNTTNAVKKFQEVFSLPQTGQVNQQTYYKISYILTAVKDLTDSIYS